MNRIGDKEFREQWIAALRSGDFTQGTQWLRTTDDEYCCIGVACSLLPDTTWSVCGDAGYVAFVNDVECCGSLQYPQDIGLTDTAQEALIDLNDSQGFTFSEIADVLEAGVYDEKGILI